MSHRVFPCTVKLPGEQTDRIAYVLAGSPRPAAQYEANPRKGGYTGKKPSDTCTALCRCSEEPWDPADGDPQRVLLGTGCTYAPSSLRRAKNFLTRYSGSI